VDDPLSNWVRLILFDTATDMGDRIMLSDRLCEFGVLPSRTWQTLPTELLDADATEELYGAVRVIARRHAHLAEELASWEQLHSPAASRARHSAAWAGAVCT
jgi:hypothetical protein